MRSKEEIRGLVAGFAKSGLTRREYCAQHNIAITTLDYWRRTQKRQKPKLVEVAIEPASPGSSEGFAVVLVNGRRIESPWKFTEADLARAIRVAEA
jgi:hypothetical protein